MNYRRDEEEERYKAEDAGWSSRNPTSISAISLTTKRCVDPLHPPPPPPPPLPPPPPPPPPVSNEEISRTPISPPTGRGVQLQGRTDNEPDTMRGPPRRGTAVGFVALLNALLFAAQAAQGVLTDHLVVQLHEDAQDEAHQVATQHGCQARKIPFADGLFHFYPSDTSKRRSKRSSHVRQHLQKDRRVKNIFEQEGFSRQKRGYRNINDIEVNMSDPLFTKQWYLINTGQADGTPGLDLNVAEAWQLGYTGKGVTIAIMDDGIDYLHPDLASNYNADASYDFSSNDPYPFPRYTGDWFNSHGTRCAGEVSAAANNNICGVGVAYNSKVAGIRMLDQPFMTDIIEASSISHMPQIIDIYSASWGPTDDGKTVDGPRELTLQAMADGVNKGRGGKGSIYVWASGDGGSYDDCNCDGYASSMWTISINSAINDGRTALYDESCSSTLASTFSNGRKRNPEAGVATTDLYGNCTLRHSGTSAAAPEAAGVFALALEANPNLTWRDMQHLSVLTSKRNQLHDEVHQWRRNGVGLEFNHLFGYGVLDAGGMVKMAKDWKTVPERFHCVAGSIQEPHKIQSGNKLVLTITTEACQGKDNFVRYLEHVQAVLTVNASRRGDLNINMTSPMGTKSILLSRRPRDDDAKVGFDKWPFMTTHTWGEDPRGTWVLEVGFQGEQPQRGVLKEWTLMLHGTQSAPYIDQIVRDYQSKLAMSKKEELEEELDEAVERSLKSLLSKKN
ncbi:neuroendocrine convertase 2 [Kryptolebias marmoratus]|uniref:Neuroendocrine convertase 2 n=1 Tax=Kryptolebias marmoratus TaxID=37003 RepID=A0A3Q3B8N4_KRYMA|nr:neuroendocrine convertase 2 [Kryptolebias marmoratus]